MESLTSMRRCRVLAENAGIGQVVGIGLICHCHIRSAC